MNAKPFKGQLTVVRRCFWGMKISEQRERHALGIKQKVPCDGRSWRPVLALEIVAFTLLSRDSERPFVWFLDLGGMLMNLINLVTLLLILFC
ncbi:hypothetical protein P5673_011828 [Acropora cervicornis]|uniref:Uncharacterized protein n=1 Tax=Acropora cervicornis TaxID=6130 RepID=A0AAD9QNV3_ACRCE|nr:hypothetical protein P5673_011828 [Acropora cervicornis]